MKIFDEKGRLFGKFNIIDLLAVLAVLLLVAGLFLRSNGAQTTNADIQSEKFYYTAEVRNISDRIVDEFQVGDKIYNEAYGAEFGTITDIKVEESKTWNVTVDGQYVFGTSPGRSTLIITVETDGFQDENGRFMIDRMYEIEPNYQCYMFSRYVKFFFYVIDVYK